MNALFDRVNADSHDEFFEFRAFKEDKKGGYDKTISSIYQTLYDLRDENTREPIEEIGLYNRNNAKSSVAPTRITKSLF